MEEKIEEKTMERKLRKVQDNLVIAGTGLIAFNTWTFIRAIIMLIALRKEIKEQVEALNDSVPMWAIVAVLLGLIVLLILPYLYVGVSARKDGMGRKKKKKAYIVIAIILVIPSSIFALYSIIDFFLVLSISSLVTAAIDLTTVGVVVETVTMAIRMKKYQKKLEAEK